MKYDGRSVTVSRRVRGSGTGYTQVLSTSSAGVTSADRMRVALSANGSYSFDDFALLADRGDPIETVVYAHIDGANPAAGTAQYYLHDHLGSARQLRAAGGALTAAYDYSPYGEVLGAPHPAGPAGTYTARALTRGFETPRRACSG